MEKKFWFTEQKTINILKIPKEGLNRTDKRENLPEKQDQEQPQEKGKEKYPEKDYSETELPVVLSSTSRNNSQFQSVFSSQLLGNVTSDYLKLVNSIECRQCVPRSGDLRVPGGESAALVRHQEEAQSKTSIGFVELFRRRSHYLKLGVPLTAIELIAMSGFACNWEAQSGVQNELTTPLPENPEQEQLTLESESSQSVVDCCEIDYTKEFDEKRLPGGYRRSNYVCADIDDGEIAESSSKNVTKDQEEKVYPSSEHNNHYYKVRSNDCSGQQETMYNTPILDQMELLADPCQITHNIYRQNIYTPQSDYSQLPITENEYKSQIISQVNCSATVPDTQHMNSLAQTELPVEEIEFNRIQTNPRKYELQMGEMKPGQYECHLQTAELNEFPQSIPSGDQGQSIYKSIQGDNGYHAKEETHRDQYKNNFLIKENLECVTPMNHPRSASVVPEEWQPQIPLIRDELTPDIIQRIQDAEIRMLPISKPLISSHDLKKVPTECNIAERLKHQQKQSISITESIQKGHGMQQRFKKVWPPNPEGAALEIILSPKYYESTSEEDEMFIANKIHDIESNNNVSLTPPASSSFESPFNLQPDRLKALLKAKPKKSCLKNSIFLENRNDNLMTENQGQYSFKNEQHGYEADYETQSEESLERTTSECTAEDHNLFDQSSIDTLTDVWYRVGEDRQLIMAAASIPSTLPRLTGGLYSQVDKLKFQPIDKLDAGSAGTPILDEQGARTANERTAYFATEFAKLTREERAQDIELRMSQLRLLQATSDRRYRRFLKANGSLNWRQLSSEAIDSLKHFCPLSGSCSTQCPLLLNESLLGHFIKSHLFEPGMELCEIFERDRLLIIFNPRSFDLGKNVCMSVIVYGGFRDSPYSLPIMRYMPVYNVGLSHMYTRYAGHLPLLVLICRNRLNDIDGLNDQCYNGNSSSSSTNSNSSSKKVRFNDQSNHNTLSDGEGEASLPGSKVPEDVLALWVVSMELPQPIHVVMTVFNRRLDITRSSIMKVRGLNKSHNCNEFMTSSEHYMRLTEQDMRILTNNYTESIYMELSVREYAASYPTEAISALR